MGMKRVTSPATRLTAGSAMARVLSPIKFGIAKILHHGRARHYGPIARRAVAPAPVQHAVGSPEEPQ
jgi:hypothetical protein